MPTPLPSGRTPKMTLPCPSSVLSIAVSRLNTSSGLSREATNMVGWCIGDFSNSSALIRFAIVLPPRSPSASSSPVRLPGEDLGSPPHARAQRTDLPPLRVQLQRPFKSSIACPFEGFRAPGITPHRRPPRQLASSPRPRHGGARSALDYNSENPQNRP